MVSEQTIKPFSEDNNLEAWSRRVQALMASKECDVVCCVPQNEFQEKPLLLANSLSTASVREWTSMDKKARNIITETITSSVLVISDLRTAAEQWKKLETTYNMIMREKKRLWAAEFHSFTLLPGEKIQSFFNRFDELLCRMREAAQEPNEDNQLVRPFLALTP